jgi:hypothetical protein
MDSPTQDNLPAEENREADAGCAQSRRGGFSPERIWILGAGRFGRIAAERLTTRYPEAELLVVDHRAKRLSELRDLAGVSVRREDAVTFICRRPLPDDQWIVPAVPLHVVQLWLLQMLHRDGQVMSLAVPEAADVQVPNPYRVPAGTLYTSYATFLCPDACSEPEKLCTHTGRPRPGNLFECLGGIEVPEFRVEVIRSWQLAPGVGGYRGAQLQAALRRIREYAGRVIIATSCRCHAVIDALAFVKG